MIWKIEKYLAIHNGLLTMYFALKMKIPVKVDLTLLK